MDKYFESDYDPRLDLGEVPRNGYVPEVGWDNMLAILKERGKKVSNPQPTALFLEGVSADDQA
jgi:hypothetical protein